MGWDRHSFCGQPVPKTYHPLIRQCSLLLPLASSQHDFRALQVCSPRTPQDELLLGLPGSTCHLRGHARVECNPHTAHIHSTQVRPTGSCSCRYMLPLWWDKPCPMGTRQSPAMRQVFKESCAIGSSWAEFPYSNLLVAEKEFMLHGGQLVIKNIVLFFFQCFYVELVNSPPHCIDVII